MFVKKVNNHFGNQIKDNLSGKNIRWKIVTFMLIAIFITVVCLYFYTKYNNAANSRFGGINLLKIYAKNDLFETRFVYNHIRDSYPIWTSFAKLNKNWLRVLQIGSVFILIAFIAFEFIFIKNKIMFGSFTILFTAIMFNIFDSVVDGKVIDYLIFNKPWDKIMLFITWPEMLFSRIVSNPSGPGEIISVLNLPDLFIGIGVNGIIIAFIYNCIKKINKKVYRINIKKHLLWY